jgi:AcrR family transcriptional regulator
MARLDKRCALITAAAECIHQKGFQQATLVNIAEKSNVPLGNVYYYFQSKEAILGAILQEKNLKYAEFRQSLDLVEDPQRRLILFLSSKPEELELISRYGCELGSLCQELGKLSNLLADQAAKLLHDILIWCETQFKALGFGRLASDYALNMISTIQGAYLLANTFNDPNIVKKQITELQKWLEQLVTAKVRVEEFAFS